MNEDEKEFEMIGLKLIHRELNYSSKVNEK